MVVQFIYNHLTIYIVELPVTKKLNKKLKVDGAVLSGARHLRSTTITVNTLVA